MENINKKIALCPGSFDPITIGHMDIIQRASRLFDEVIVLVSVNANKNCTFTFQERVDMIKIATSDLKNIRVDSFEGLLADYVKENHVDALVKGLRALSDFDYEFQMALANKKLNSDLETVFLTCDAEHMYLSSSLVRQIGQLGGDISDFVPDNIANIISAKWKNQ